jgi:HPt (histidine-containing phosphotransfer) domain-containing protein
MRVKGLDPLMDEFASKPFQKSEPPGVVELHDPITGRDASFEAGDRRSDRAFDRQAVLEQADGDEEFVAEVIGLFLDDVPGRMAEIRQAVQQCDAKHLTAAAHVFKGSAGCLSAGATMAAAFRLEEIGKSGQLSDAAEALTDLEQELQCLVEALSIELAEGRRSQ